MDWNVLGALADKAGAISILLALAWALKKEELVTGSQHRQEQAARVREEQRAERAEERADRLEATVLEATKALAEQTNTNARTTRILEALARGRSASDE